jgi:C1A family cysteine protease
VIDRRAEQTAVFDQGPRGTCAACAVTSGHEWVRQGESLSVEDAFDRGKRRDPWPQQDCTSVDCVVRGISEDQHAIESAWPYGEPSYPGPPPPETLKDANRRPLAGTWSVGSVGDVLDAVESRCAVMTLAFVPSAWERQDGVVDVGSEPAQDAHAVLAVGSDVRNGEDVVIIKNSWGTDWGDGGYGYVTAGYLRRHLLAVHLVEKAA